MVVTVLQLRHWLSSIFSSRSEDRGAALVEYALLLVLITIVCVVALTVLGDAASGGLEKGADGFATN